MNNLSSCKIVSFSPQQSTPIELSDFLDEYFEVTACNYTDEGKEEYVGYAAVNFDAADMEKAAVNAGIQLPSYKIELLENKNWLTENVIKFAPVETSKFCIYGIHEKQAPQTNKLLLQIYAATAFGSDHPTTKCCLQAISDLDDLGINRKNILDMGTGSGILSLACAKLWQKETPFITAVDIDDEAVNVTRQNASNNNLSQYFQIAQSDGYKSDLVKLNAPYDIIIANILARPLIEMAPKLAESLKPGGYCILSGFVDEQVSWVIDAHHKEGMSIVKTYNIDNWHAVLMQKAETFQEK